MTTTTTTYHVTAIRNGSVYGHDTAGCDPSGCAGDERFLVGVYPSDAAVGDVVEIGDAEMDPQPRTATDDQTCRACGFVGNGLGRDGDLCPGCQESGAEVRS